MKTTSLFLRTYNFVLLIFVSAIFSITAIAQSGQSINGTVQDQSGAVIDGATVTLLRVPQAVVKTASTDSGGKFTFDNLPGGSYELLVTRRGFSDRRLAVQLNGNNASNVMVELTVGSLEEVSVTAETGQAQDKDKLVQQVNIIGEDAIRQRTTGVLSQVADEEVGVYLQRTSPVMSAIFVRGLTGKNVSVYIDGVRYTNSAQRGGVSTFFNLTEPSSLRSVEILRGPNSAQYGSDSLGGTINLISRVPQFGFDKPEWHTQVNTFYTSADNSFGANNYLSYGTQRFGIYVNTAARRVNNLRPADGLDGHAAVTRFLGLPSSVINGDRLPDTAFTQYGGTFHMNYSPSIDQQFIFHIQRNQQDGGKRYDQLLGGDGNLIADLRNLMQDFAYARYIKQGFGIFDSASFSVSYNSQREERVNQGGQGQSTGVITHQYERTSTYGFNLFFDKRIGERNTLLIGADYYHEKINSPAYDFNPVNNRFTLSRPRVPDEARYITAGYYIQDTWDVVPDWFRLSGALRYNVASYRARAADSPIVSGQPLWPNDSLRVDDFSGRIGAVVTPFEGFNFHLNYSRGFRYPSMTDLGTLGLTGSGFEVDFNTARALGGTIGSTADATATNTGIPVEQQRSEFSNNIDAGVSYRNKWIDTDFTFFNIDINDNIVKQSLILPLGSVGRFLGTQPITSQSPNGVVFVALSTNPVLARVNYSDARIQGVEFSMKVRFNRNWSFNSNFTGIRAEDRANGLPPNIEGGTPPPVGFLSLRYTGSSNRWWIEGYSTLAARQNRLSTLDLGDRRTGGTRTRAQIQNFFRRGACERGLVGRGPDGRCGTNDETILLLTGETLAQVQNRVLGSANSAPLFTYLPGYGLFNVRGGFRVGERSEFGFDFENITDQSYRGPSWGIDGPGRSVTLRYNYRF